jgi:hypothetical protein
MKKFTILTLSLFITAAHATVWYVHPDSALNSIQAALDSCSRDDTVLVGPGTYTYGGGIEWPNVQGIDLISEYGPDSTIINVLSIEIITQLVDWNTIINGFTIRASSLGGIILNDGASPIISNNIISGCDWCGIGCFGNSSAFIYNNTLTGNCCTELEGGVIYCNWSSSPIISRNTIIDNAGSGITCIGAESSPLIDSCNIINNSVGIACFSAMPLITNNTITYNGGCGGGILCATNSSPTIENNIIHNNYGSGVESSYGADPVINYNDIFWNSGYGVTNLDSSIIIDARYNWWGDATGPYHPDSNPGGLGDSVSDYVNFTPWLDTPFGIEEYKPIPTKFTALQIYPNPFRDQVTINYCNVLGAKSIELKIYDITGRSIRQFDCMAMRLSDHIVWDGYDDTGNRVPSSIYFITFSAGDYRETKKLVLLR